MKKMNVDSRLTIRYATMDDADLLLAWRNEPTVRAMSKNMEFISKEQHIPWLSNILQAKTSCLYICLCDSKEIGAIRFDNIQLHDWTINIMLDVSVRGCGYAAFLCRKAICCFSKQVDKYNIIAEVKQENEPSKYLFLRLGFFEKENENGIVTFILKETLECNFNQI